MHPKHPLRRGSHGCKFRLHIDSSKRRQRLFYCSEVSHFALPYRDVGSGPRTANMSCPSRDFTHTIVVVRFQFIDDHRQAIEPQLVRLVGMVPGKLIGGKTAPTLPCACISRDDRYGCALGLPAAGSSHIHTYCICYELCIGNKRKARRLIHLRFYRFLRYLRVILRRLFLLFLVGFFRFPPWFFL